MSGRKNNLPSFHLVSAQSMASNVLSIPTNIHLLDNVGIQLNFTGTPTGTFAIQLSADYSQDSSGNVINSGNWVPLTLTPAPVASGSAGTIYLDLNQISAPWIRVVYTAGSGSGTLDVYITAKMI